jgi:hypothetical protein
MAELGAQSRSIYSSIRGRSNFACIIGIHEQSNIWQGREVGGDDRSKRPWLQRGKTIHSKRRGKMRAVAYDLSQLSTVND